MFNFKSKESKEYFISHLQYIMNLSMNQKARREDFIFMRKLLKEYKHWKGRPRNKGDKDHWKKLKYKKMAF